MEGRAKKYERQTDRTHLRGSTRKEEEEREGKNVERKGGRKERGVTVREGGVHAIYLSSRSGKNVVK